MADIPEDVVLTDLNGKVLAESTLNRLRSAIEAAQQKDIVVVHLPDTHFCEVDGRPIRMISFKGTGVCCRLCQMVRDGEKTPEQAAEIRKSHGSARDADRH